MYQNGRLPLHVRHSDRNFDEKPVPSILLVLTHRSALTRFALLNCITIIGQREKKQAEGKPVTKFCTNWYWRFGHIWLMDSTKIEIHEFNSFSSFHWLPLIFLWFYDFFFFFWFKLYYRFKAWRHKRAEDCHRCHSRCRNETIFHKALMIRNMIRNEINEITSSNRRMHQNANVKWAASNFWINYPH